MEQPENISYSRIQQILRNADINSQTDIQKLKVGGTYTADMLSRPQWVQRFFSSLDYPWITEIYMIVRDGYEVALRDHQKIGRSAIVVNEPYGFLYYHDWQPGDSIFQLRASLSCIFPKKVLYVSSKFVYNEDDDSFWIPEDFLASFISLAPILMAGYARLLPKRIRIERDPLHFSENDKTAYHYFTNESYLTASKGGQGYESFQRGVSCDQPLDYILKLPWLATQDIRHCVDIMEEYPDQFNIYCETVSNALSHDGADKIEEWITEVAKASREIDAIYKSQMRDLKKKGLITLAGLVPSAVCLFLPESHVKDLVQTFLTSKTAQDGFEWFQDLRQAKNIISDKDNWLIWRMKH